MHAPASTKQRQQPKQRTPHSGLLKALKSGTRPLYVLPYLVLGILLRHCLPRDTRKVSGILSGQVLSAEAEKTHPHVTARLMGDGTVQLNAEERPQIGHIMWRGSRLDTDLDLWDHSSSR